MKAYILTFLKKFIATLYLFGVNTIPFSGTEFQNGIEQMKEYLQNNLPIEDYEKISDIFVKLPVQEMYNNIRDQLMSLNGENISFAGVDNPYWTKASIKMNEYYAYKTLNDNEICDIDSEIIKNATNIFCEAAGVIIWE